MPFCGVFSYIFSLLISQRIQSFPFQWSILEFSIGSSVNPPSTWRLHEWGRTFSLAASYFAFMLYYFIHLLSNIFPFPFGTSWPLTLKFPLVSFFFFLILEGSLEKVGKIVQKRVQYCISLESGSNTLGLLIDSLLIWKINWGNPLSRVHWSSGWRSGNNGSV